MSIPDRRGHFGGFGGKYVPETLMAALAQLEALRGANVVIAVAGMEGRNHRLGPDGAIYAQDHGFGAGGSSNPSSCTRSSMLMRRPFCPGVESTNFSFRGGTI